MKADKDDAVKQKAAMEKRLTQTEKKLADEKAAHDKAKEELDRLRARCAELEVEAVQA